MNLRKKSKKLLIHSDPLMKKIIFGFLAIWWMLASCDRAAEKNQARDAGDTIKSRISQLTEKIREDASNAELYNTRAQYYIFDKQLDLALRDVNKAISIDSRKGEYYITLSDTYLVMGQPDNSRDALLRARELEPGNTKALLKLAKLYLIVKDYKDCYATVNELLTLDHNNAQAHYTRAIGLLEQGDTNRAVGDLLKAADKNQEFYEAYIELGELFSIRKDKVAETYLRNALNLRPDSKEALYMLGMFYQETGQYEKAVSIYTNLARIDTSFRDAPYNIGYIYLVYLKDFKRSIRFFDEALKKDPMYYQAYYNRGYAYELSGNYAHAREDYKQALKILVNYDKAVEGLNRLDKLEIRK